MKQHFLSGRRSERRSERRRKGRRNLQIKRGIKEPLVELCFQSTLISLWIKKEPLTIKSLRRKRKRRRSNSRRL
jgi:hypothetical protein